MLQTKSKDRVREIAEVYTNEREVNAMLDLIPIDHPDDIIRYKYLEPACGNGNFLIEILNRKLTRVNEKYAHKSMRVFEFFHARALSTIYGIDICHENVVEARERLYRAIKSNIDMHKGSIIYSEGFFPLIRYLLQQNIVWGDAINGAHRITLIDYKVEGKSFEQRRYKFATLDQKNPRPIAVIPRQHFLAIGMEYQSQSGCEDERIQRHFELV
ncbi:MAG: SAM-dependent DNA methyltransferase [Pseudomonadota bacterium]